MEPPVAGNGVALVTGTAGCSAYQIELETQHLRRATHEGRVDRVGRQRHGQTDAHGEAPSPLFCPKSVAQFPPDVNRDTAFGDRRVVPDGADQMAGARADRADTFPARPAAAEARDPSTCRRRSDEIHHAGAADNSMAVRHSMD